MDIYVKKIGEWPGYYRTYYKNVMNNNIYAKIEFRNMTDWYTCDRNGGEPNTPIREDINMIVIDDLRKSNVEDYKEIFGKQI